MSKLSNKFEKWLDNADLDSMFDSIQQSSDFTGTILALLEQVHNSGYSHGYIDGHNNGVDEAVTKLTGPRN